MKIADDLYNGSVLDAEEFHRKYLHSNLRKVELVRGRVRMPFPVSWNLH